MRTSFIKKRGVRSGFTLIELLVVIAIIGVLASIVLASLNTARKKSRDARRITDIKQIQLALELYYDGQSPSPQYPPAVTTCSATVARGLQVLVTGGFIPQVPRDPQGAVTANCYLYASAPLNVVYHLGAKLEETKNLALNSDKDCDSALVGGTGSCGPAAYTAPFDGGVTVLDDVGGIYDVVP